MSNEIKRQECLIYSRVCGWLAPTANFNPGKKAERLDRLNFSNEKATK
jgi:anaerobic ribonucleoside-triphosphate reductase